MDKNNAINEVLEPGEVLDVTVDNATGRGLLGIAIQPNFTARVIEYGRADWTRGRSRPESLPKDSEVLVGGFAPAFPLPRSRRCSC